MARRPNPMVAVGILAFPSLLFFIMEMKSRHVIVVDIASVTPGYSLLSEGAWVRNNINGLLSDVDCEHESSFNDPPVRESAKNFLSSDAILRRTANCDAYFKVMNAFGTKLSDARLHREEETPMAFSHSIHKQAGILEMFLAVTFRPGDSHCVHIDPKADEATTKAIKAVIGCYNDKFPNATVFAVPHPVSVFWGHISVLESDLMCLRQLLERNQKWHYWTNPAASEMPILSAEEMSATLRGIGESVVESFKNSNPKRHKVFHQLVRRGPREYDMKAINLDFELPPPPHDLVIRKGSKNVALRRDFAHFVVHDSLSINLLNFLQNTEIPDEHFYSTLATVEWSKIKGQYGSVKQDLKCNCTHGGCVRRSWWIYPTKIPAKKPPKHTCHGQTVRAVCNFGTADLPVLREEAVESRCLTANKFNLDVDPVAIICQAKEIVHRTEMLYWREDNAT